MFVVPRKIAVAWSKEWPIKSGNEVKIQSLVSFSFYTFMLPENGCFQRITVGAFLK